MASPKSTIAKFSICLLSLILASHAAFAAPPADESRAKLAVLDPLVGSWLFEAGKQEGFSVRQECKWILNNNFLEINTYVRRSGQPSTSWRTLISYDQISRRYRQWKFSDNGAVSTEHGAWNEESSTLMLSGRTLKGRASQSSVEILNHNTICVAVRELIDDSPARMAVVRATLRRVTPTQDHSAPQNGP